MKGKCSCRVLSREHSRFGWFLEALFKKNREENNLLADLEKI